MNKRLKKLCCVCLCMMLVLTAALSLTSCGQKYTYSSVKMTAKVNGETFNEGLESFQQMYEMMFKDSVLTVSNNKLVLNIDDQKSVMNVKKDGDKYVLSGDYVDKMKTAMSTGLGDDKNIDFGMYGVKTDSGFDLVVTASVSMEGVTSSAVATISYAK